MSGMSEREVKGHLERMDGVLREAAASLPRGFLRANLQADFWTPLEEVMAREEAAMRAVALDGIDVAQRVMELDGLPEPVVAEVQARAREVFQELESAWLEFFFLRGPNPLDVLRALFAYVKLRRPDLLWNMGVREIGRLFDESHGAVSARVMALFGDVGAGVRKSLEARRKMSEAQKGNKCRLGGKKARQAEGFSSEKLTNERE